MGQLHTTYSFHTRMQQAADMHSSKSLCYHTDCTNCTVSAAKQTRYMPGLFLFY
jgi:hypothetical protein